MPALQKKKKEKNKRKLRRDEKGNQEGCKNLIGEREQAIGERHQ